MIYFLAKADRSAIKIGTTIRLSARLKELAAEHGDLEVLAITDGSYPEEKSLHQRFAELRTVGEWFEPGDDLLGFIVAEGKPWSESGLKPVRLDLTEEVHRMLRKLAADDGVSMAAFTRDTLERVIREDFKRRGLK